MNPDNNKWIICSILLPVKGVAVWTKIDDFKGMRNVQKLKLIGNLWYFEDGSMYVYYQPTHWQSIN